MSSSTRAAEQGGDLLLAEHLFQHRPVQRDHHQAVDRGVGQLQAPVAAHRVDDVDEQRLRNGVAGEADERVDDLLGVVARRARVPERQRGDAVGVDVLGCALQLGERSDRDARLRRARVVDLQQQRLVRLDDERPVGHAISLPGGSMRSGSARQQGATADGYTPTALSKERTRADEILPAPDGYGPSPNGRVSRSRAAPDRRRTGFPRCPSTQRESRRGKATHRPWTAAQPFRVAVCRPDVSQFGGSSPPIVRGTLT